MQEMTGTFVRSLAVLLVALTAGEAVADESRQRRPNFIIFFTDDQGYADVGCFGATDFQTPNFDRMAAEGLKLTSFYAQPVGEKHNWQTDAGRIDRPQLAHPRAADQCRHVDCAGWSVSSPDRSCRSWPISKRQWALTKPAWRLMSRPPWFPWPRRRGGLSSY